MSQLNNVTGAVALGDNFYDRVREQRELWQRLATDSVLLLAPRRVGKTSLLRRLEETAALERYEAVYVSVSHHRTELDLIEALVGALANHKAGRKLVGKLERKSALSRFIPKLDELDLKVASFRFANRDDAPWTDLADALSAALSGHTSRWLIIIDELPIFVTRLLDADPERASVFMTWFRQLRLELGGHGLVRWLLAGSIGLDTVAKRHALGGTINDLFVMGLGAFEAEVADGFLETLSASYGLPLSRDLRSLIVERLGWPLPYFLQLLFAELRSRCGDRGVVPTATGIHDAYQALLAPERKASLDPWVQRLPKTFGPTDGALARALLGVVARNPDGDSRDNLRLASANLAPHAPPGTLALILDALETDGYLVEAHGRYRFRSPLLRDYWLRRVIA